MDVLHEDDGKKGHFYIEDNGKEAAGMYYTWAAEKMIIEHTEVDDAYNGRGLGKQLVKAAVEYARTHSPVKILPLCPFAKGVFDRVPEYGDVLV